MHSLRKHAILIFVIAVFLTTANARVVRVEVTSRTDLQQGKPFGLAGAYEKIVGRVWFAVKPDNTHNRQIVDLDKAPRNAQGEVEFSADLYLIRPKDPNRGNGAEIHGLARADFNPSEKVNDMPLGHILLGANGGKSYAVDDPASAKNVLTVRDTPTGERQVIPRSQWSFAHEAQGQVAPDTHFVHLNGGFLPGKIYELVYTAKNPAVAGLGMAAVRDFLSYLKYDPQAVAPVQRAYAVGISQSGRFLRHFIYQDFNSDEQDRQAIDGVIAHVAGAGRGSFNHRFAQPSRDAQPMSSLMYPTDLFPFTDLPETDPETGETAGVQDAIAPSHHAPK